MAFSPVFLLHIPDFSAKSPPDPGFTAPAGHMTSSCVCLQGFTCSGQEAGGSDEELHGKSRGVGT